MLLEITSSETTTAQTLDAVQPQLQQRQESFLPGATSKNIVQALIGPVDLSNKNFREVDESRSTSPCFLKLTRNPDRGPTNLSSVTAAYGLWDTIPLGVGHALLRYFGLISSKRNLFEAPPKTLNTIEAKQSTLQSYVSIGLPCTYLQCSQNVQKNQQLEP